MNYRLVQVAVFWEFRGAGAGWVFCIGLFSALAPDVGLGAIRFSLGRDTTEAEIAAVTSLLKRVI